MRRIFFLIVIVMIMLSFGNKLTLAYLYQYQKSPAEERRLTKTIEKLRPKSVQSLMKIVQNGREKYLVREAAAVVLGEKDDEKALPALYDLVFGTMIYHKDFALGDIEQVVAVRGAAKRAYRKIELNREVRMLRNESAESLMNIVKDKTRNTLTRTAAVVLLGEKRETRIIPVLEDVYNYNYTDTANIIFSQEAAVPAAKTIVQIEMPKGLNNLEKLRYLFDTVRINKPQPFLKKGRSRFNGALWLLEDQIEDLLKDETVMPVVIDALNDENGSVRLKATKILKQYPDERALEGLIKNLGTPFKKRGDIGWGIRISTISALGALGNEKAIGPLAQILKDETENKYMRQVAAEALAQIGNRKSIKILTDALDSDQTVLRNASAFALGQIRNRRAEETLIKTVEGEDKESKLTAISTLGKLKSHRAVTTLIEALKDEDAEVRIYAAKALGEIGNKTAIAALKNVMYDDTTTPSSPLSISSIAEISLDKLGIKVERIDDKYTFIQKPSKIEKFIEELSKRKKVIVISTVAFVIALAVFLVISRRKKKAAAA